MPVRGDNSLFFSSALDNSGLQQGAFDAVGIVQGLAGTIAKINPFGALAIGAAGAFSLVGNQAYQMMKKFESAMAEVKTIANLTEEDFKSLSQEVFNLSQELGTETPDALAKGLYDIIGAGYAATDALKLLETSSKAATAGVTSSAVAADGLTTILNSFGLAASDATDIADQMFQVVNLGKISFDQLASNIAQVAPLAAASGFSFQEIGAAIATLTKQGIPASEAMTQIRSGIISIGEVMGDGVAKTMTLQNAFEVLYQRAGGSQDELKNLVGRVEAMNAVLSIAGPNLKGATQDLMDMADAAGAVNKANEHITSTTENQWKILGNRISTTTKAIGEGLVTISNGLAKFLNESLENSEDLKKSFDEQRLKLIELERGLKTAVVGSEEYKNIKAQIIEQFPEYLSGIDTETASTEDLLKVLDRVNESYRERYKLAQRIQELEIEEQKAGNIEMNIEDFEKQFGKALDRLELIAKNKNIKLNIDYNDSKEEIIKSVEDQLKGVEGALDFYYGEGKDKLVKKGFAAEDLSLLRQYSAHVVELNKDLEKQNKLVAETSEKSRTSAQEQLQTESGRLVILEKISEAKKASDLADYTGSGIEVIETAINARMAVIDKLQTIGGIYNKKGLSAYLKDENKEIQEAAKERLRIINTEFSGTGGGSGEKDKKTFSDILEDRKKQYEAYYAAIEQLGQEAADKIFNNLLKGGSSFPEYLKSLLEKTKSEAEMIAIAVAAQVSGIDLNRDVAGPVSTLQPKGLIDSQPYTNDFTLSIDYINEKIRELNEELSSSTSKIAKKRLEAEVTFWDEKLSLAQEGAAKEKNIYETIPADLDDLNNASLKKYRAYWKEQLLIAKDAQNKLAQNEALLKVGAADKIMGERTSDSLDDISGSLKEASNMFREFGDDVLADALDKLGGLATNMASIIAGISSGDWVSVIGGVIGGITSLFSGSGRDRNKKSEFEITMDGLEESVNRLAKSLDMVYGDEAISRRTRMLEDLERQREEIVRQRDALVAEGAADPMMAYLLQPYIDRLNQDLDDLDIRIHDTNEEFRDYLTGTTRDSIADSIIQGFREGHRGIEDFASTFEDLMKEAMLNAFKQNYLQSLLTGPDGFYAQFAEMNTDGLSVPEIEALKRMWEEIITGAEGAFEGMNAVFGNMGWDAFGADSSSQREGLSGAITNITEDTANLLAGYMNAVRLDIRQGLEVNQQSLIHLSEIASNTRYNRHLEQIATDIHSIDGRMRTVEGGIREYQAQG